MALSTEISGTLPNGLGQIADLKYLYAPACASASTHVYLCRVMFGGPFGGRLSGTLPFNNNKALELTAVLLENNQISGSVPGELAIDALIISMFARNKVPPAVVSEALRSDSLSVEWHHTSAPIKYAARQPVSGELLTVYGCTEA